MRSSLQPLRWGSWLFCLGLLLRCGEAKVHTEAQVGPLYRVLGSLLSISCNVSGFQDPNAQKEFEFRVKRPNKPGLDINIISTSDKKFAYAAYDQRVESGDVTLKRLSPNSVVFEIQSLQKSDEGEFDCSVINSEPTYNGIYSAKTTVKVIDNSLSVSSHVSTSLSHNEGEALTLTCQASSNTIQHTHLSFAWYLHRDSEGDARPIMSLDRDFTLSPGQGFEGRYQAELIRLDKLGEATYRLKMAELELSDQGRIYCQAQEWIQDPDRSWYSIAQKNSEETTLNVKAREVVPDTLSLVVRISTQQTTLQEGQELSLSCNVDTQSQEIRFFSVAWLRGSVELARIGPTGVLSVGAEYSGRENDGELRATRIGDKDYRLILKPVRTLDQGEYFCRAWPQNRAQDGDFSQGEAQDSSPQLISISATESGLSVEMQSKVSVNEGDRLCLTCKVDGVKGQLSVTWQHKSTSTLTVPFNNVISLSQEGVMEIQGKFMSRKVRAMRLKTDTFTLELDEVTPSDSGVYQCAVSEWKTNTKIKSQSQTTTVTVVPTESLVALSLISRNNRATVGGNVELMCRVRGPRVPITLTWSLQRDASNVDTILSVNSDGGISWSGDQHGYQLKVENNQNGVFHYLLINGARQRQAGRYQCVASVFRENVYKKLPPSNALAVMVENPVSKLTLNSSSALTKNVDADVEIKCLAVSKPFATSRFAVTWLHQQSAENKTLVSSDRDGLVTFGTQVDVSSRQRISVRRTKGPSFELTIRQAQISDNGFYRCVVVEWLQDPGGDWYQLPPVSKVTELTIVEPETKLSIGMGEEELNVSLSQDFTIPCNIIKQTSSESQFQVTWFWKIENEQKPIFTFYRNATLQDRSGKGDLLKFGHPLLNHFSLTVMKPGPKNSGLYFCEIEEWLPSLSLGWRKVATEKSGYWTVNVHAEGGAVAEPQCQSIICMGVLVVYVVCSLLVIGLLVVKICRSNSSGEKKLGPSLWAEEHPLKPKPSGED